MGEVIFFVAFFGFLTIYLFWPYLNEVTAVIRFKFYYYPKGMNKANFTSARINPYYSKLNEQLRMKFAWRAFFFHDTTTIEFHQFEGYKGADFEKIRYLLSGVAAQMTLFLPEICFKMIHKIIVYPEPYVSRITHNVHKGETNPAAGIVVFTLTGIQEGIQEPYDGINLILHEYSHALWLEHKLTRYETFSIEAADRFEDLAKRELERAQQTEGHFFRNYGLTSLVEFIAVATENFFERPHEFKKRLPDIYKAMTELYRQDPSKLLP